MTAFIRCSSSVRDILVEDVLVDAICVGQRTAECAGDWLFSAHCVALGRWKATRLLESYP